MARREEKDFQKNLENKCLKRFWQGKSLPLARRLLLREVAHHDAAPQRLLSRSLPGARTHYELLEKQEAFRC